jgi:S-adenosylmethionine:tRNA ribosyltransferase-isomerase
MKLSEFDYNLPEELIAQKAVFPRDHARLMVVSDRIEHKYFYNLIDYLYPGDVLVINETKVLRCKLLGKKESGSPYEVYVVGKDDGLYKVRIKGRNPRSGVKILFDDFNGEIVREEGEIFYMRFSKDIDEYMQSKGTFPFPPYIKRDYLPEEEYQTIYAKHGGSVAAPTAGLHFTPELMAKIQAKGVKIARVCLHIDFGTFFNIREEEVEKHKMHEESFEITKENADIINNCRGRLIAVGTTSVRAIESSVNSGKIQPTSGKTDIYIYPGYKFKSKIAAMVTNFHLPKSSLLLLVCAFAGKDKVLSAYKEAVKEKYRFYSLGDAMLLFRENSHPQ